MDSLPYVQPGTVLYNPVFKDRVTILETASSTGGARTKLRIELAPGGGNGPHTHDSFTETFTALEGDLGVSLNGVRRVLAVGERAVVAPQAVHSFFNASRERPAVFEVELSPACAGFERSLVFAYGLAQDGLTNDKGIPRYLEHLALLAHWSETVPTGFVRLVLPLLRLLGRRIAGKPKYRGELQAYLDAAPRVDLEAEQAA